tara:strand:- start:33 stop:449 length:417 start_codon:yes stop_codon:yes gene_type:complete
MSTVKTNTLTGTTSAGSIVVTGEGGSTTTNLQQGLIKSWINFEGTNTSNTRDSFNITSITDDATGRQTVTIANDMANANYCATAGGCFDITQADDTQARQGPAVNNFATGSFRTHCGSNTYAANDWNIVTAQVSGDLA